MRASAVSDFRKCGISDEGKIMWEAAQKGLIRGIIVGIVVGAVFLPLALVKQEITWSPFFSSDSRFNLVLIGAFIGTIGGGVLGSPLGIIIAAMHYLIHSVATPSPTGPDVFIETDQTSRENSNSKSISDYPPSDDIRSQLHTHISDIISVLTLHFSDIPNVTVASDVPVSPSLSAQEDVLMADLLVVRDADRELMKHQGRYVISSQHKAPDFVLEVASPMAGVEDYTGKRANYERYGVKEYWRINPNSADGHNEALTCDLLVDGAYVDIVIEQVDGCLRGYSEVLELYVYWMNGLVRFYDPLEEQYLGISEE